MQLFTQMQTPVAGLSCEEEIQRGLEAQQLGGESFLRKVGHPHTRGEASFVPMIENFSQKLRKSGASADASPYLISPYLIELR